MDNPGRPRTDTRPSKVTEAADLLQQLSADWEQLTYEDTEEYRRRFPNPQFLGAWQEHRGIFGYTLRAELVYQLKRGLEEGDVEIAAPPRHILVDEYQDLNACDLAVIRYLTALGAELYVAGDDDQSIYGFRYAAPEGIRNFDNDYAPTNSLLLEECRRCDSRILDFALFVADQDPYREPKRLVAAAGAGTGEVRILHFRTQAREALTVASICRSLVDQAVDPGEILILLRSDRNEVFSDPLRTALQGAGVPVVTVANPTAALDTEAGRYFVTLLRLLVNREDHLAWRTMLQRAGSGIGGVSLTALYDLARANGTGFAAAVRMVVANPEVAGRVGGRIAAEVNEVDRILDDAQDEIGDDLGEFIVSLAQAQIVDEGIRREVAAVFERVLAVTTPDDLGELLRTINVSMADQEQELQPGAVNIMTMHQAKGLSADAVFVIAAEDEYLPGRAEGPFIGDERRLLYVSLTRARHYLFVTHCRDRTGAQMHTGRTAGHSRRMLTRFLGGGPVASIDGAEYGEGFGG